MPLKRNEPSASVTTVLEPILPLRLTEAPGSTPPCSSRTTPDTAPVKVWAPAVPATRRASRMARQGPIDLRDLMAFTPSPDRQLDRLAVVAGRIDHVARARGHQPDGHHSRRRAEERVASLGGRRGRRGLLDHGP